MSLVSENIDFWKDTQIAYNLHVGQGEIILSLRPYLELNNIEVIEENYIPGAIDSFVFSGVGIEIAPLYLRGIRLPKRDEVLDISLFRLNDNFSGTEFLSMMMLFRRFAKFLAPDNLIDGSLGYYSMSNGKLFNIKYKKSNTGPLPNQSLFAELVSES
jgi:hypothetical protein